MPIYEYYCPVHHTVYQFYAKTLAQGRTTPRCPDDPAHTLVKLLSSFAVTSAGNRGEPPAAGNDGAGEDPRLAAAMGAMEREFANVDESDPRAMARMMRRMAELTGEPIDGQMEEVVRKLEEGADPDSLEEELGGEPPCSMPDPAADEGSSSGRQPRFRSPRLPLRRDPKLHDYET